MATLEGLISFNEHVTGEPRDKEFSVFLKNNRNDIFGGIQAHFDTKTVYIKILWINENIRLQGYGRELLCVAEQEAVKNGCLFSISETLSFQAEEFYLKNGYKCIGEIKRYWHKHSLIFFRKKL